MSSEMSVAIGMCFLNATRRNSSQSLSDNRTCLGNASFFFFLMVIYTVYHSCMRSLCGCVDKSLDVFLVGCTIEKVEQLQINKNIYGQKL
jgi:hypothetical protein